MISADALLTLALTLPGVRYDLHAQARARATIEAIRLDARTDAEARLALVWSFRESSWRLDAIGDDGRSLGICQSSIAEIAAARSTVRAVMRSRAEAVRVCLHTIRLAHARCGGLASGLGFVATGRCSVGLYLVRRRCVEAGVVCR